MVSQRIPVLNGFIRKQGRAPTLDELCSLFNVKSKNTASVMAAKFVEAGALTLEAAEALAKEGIDVEVVDPRTLIPLDMETIAASVKKTGRALIVHPN